MKQYYVENSDEAATLINFGFKVRVFAMFQRTRYVFSTSMDKNRLETLAGINVNTM